LPNSKKNIVLSESETSFYDKTSVDFFTWTFAFGGGQWLRGSIDVNAKYTR
jgi:hypothetical protein